MKNESPGKLFLATCNFVMGVADKESFPDSPYPEIAFAGRSNVGKSSLVNSLTGQKTLAKASNTPGRTRELNFFLLDEALMMVDLPGYGYAQAGRQDVAKWTAVVKAYLMGRPNLRRVSLLIDSRHGLKDVDHEIMTMLDKAAVSYQIVLTKTDKIKPAELTQLIEKTAASFKKHPAAHPQVFTTSSVTRDGIEALRNELAGFAEKRR